eukprot:8850430-Pyramimonas_sp.AAC.1
MQIIDGSYVGYDEQACSLLGPMLGTAKALYVAGAGYFVPGKTSDRWTDQVVCVNSWGPSRNRPSRSTAVDSWGTHFTPPVVRGEPKVKMNVVSQALVGNALNDPRCRSDGLG